MNELSDGEKQILLIGIFLVGSKQKKFILLVDEPELYLNEARAIEIWHQLEVYFPEAVFAYSTHNIGFATRSSVDKSFLVGKDQPITEVDLKRPVPLDIIRSVVGTRIQILRSDNGLVFCEDQMHQMLCGDLFGNSFQIVDLGGRDKVEAAVSDEGAWSQVRSEGIRYCGVVDRDSNDDDEVSSFESKKIFCLPLYETESLLLVPKLAIWFIGICTGSVVSADEYMSWILMSARGYKPKAIRKIASFLEHRNKPKLKYNLNDEHSLTTITVEEPKKLIEDFSVRVEMLTQAIDAENIDLLLRIFPGKLLYKGVRLNCARSFGQVFKEEPFQHYRLLSREKTSCRKCSQFLASQISNRKWKRH